MSKIQTPLQITIIKEQDQNTQLILSEQHEAFIKQNQFSEPVLGKIIIQPEIDYVDPLFRQYFNGQIDKNIKKKTLALGIIDLANNQVRGHLRHGNLIIADERKFITQLLKNRPNSAKDEEKMVNCLNRKVELESELKKVQDILKNNKNENKLSKSRENISESAISSEQHKTFIQKVTKLRRQAEQKRKALRLNQENKLKQQKKQQQLAQIQKQRRQKEQKQKLIKEKMQLALKIKEKKKEQEKQINQRFKSVMQQKRRHQILEQQYYQSIVLPQQQERNKILEEIKKQKAIHIDDIRQFEKQYARAKQERELNARNKQPQTQSWHYKPPPCSVRIMKILEEQKLQSKLKIDQEKRKMEEKVARQENYKQYLKETLSVKTDQKKKLELELKIQKQTTHTKDKLPNDEIYKLGNKYLFEAKSRIAIRDSHKKQSLSAYQQAQKYPKIKEYRTKSNTSMGNYHNEPFIQLDKKFDKILSSNTIQKKDKVKKLEYQISKLSIQNQRKHEIKKVQKKNRPNEDDIDYLISSVKAKVGIIQLYKQ